MLCCQKENEKCVAYLQLLPSLAVYSAFTFFVNHWLKKFSIYKLEVQMRYLKMPNTVMKKRTSSKSIIYKNIRA